MSVNKDEDIDEVAKSFPSKNSHTLRNNASSNLPDDSNNWYMTVPNDPSEFPDCPNDTVQELFRQAEKYLFSDTFAYEAKCNNDSEKRWMRSVMTRGTARDKIASFTLMIQEAPMYNLKALESLIGLVKPSKKESLSCIHVLVEVFISNLLKPNCKLKSFANHPLSLLDELSSGNPGSRRRRLVVWYFEDKLKTLYRDFIEALQRMLKDTVDSTKEKAIGALGKLLRSNPEQEAVLLSYLVNKLGDPNKRVASKAMYCLTQTLHQHPNMKGVMKDEVEKLLFRPNIGEKARYYGLCFLAQMMFSPGDSQVAAALIKTYFSFFRACVKQGNIDSRLLKVLLSGVNRAYPYARNAMDTISEQLETLYKVVHLAPFHIALHALCLLFQVADYNNSVSDRFYSVLYRVLLNPSLPQSTHFAIFLNLLYRALKKDDSIPRIRAFVKRVLQVCCFMPAPHMCGTLFTLSHVMRARKCIATVSTDKPTEKDETVISLSTKSSLKFPEDESDDEYYEDKSLEETSCALEENHPKPKKKDAVTTWNHKKNLQTKQGRHTDNATKYDAMQRNPLFAHGELCSYTELCLLAAHFHPSVALFASKVLSGEPLSYTGDPLKDFTIPRFLERFTFKNPKKQPLSSRSSVFAKRQNYVSRGLKAFPPTSKAYMNQQEKNIPIDERFLFRYLQQRRVHRGENEDDDIEGVGDEEFDAVIDDLMAERGMKADVDGEIDQEEFDIDFANEYSRNASAKMKKMGKGKHTEDSDSSLSDNDGKGSDGSDFDDDDDEEEEEDMSEDPSDFENDGDLEDHDLKQKIAKKKLREKDELLDDDIPKSKRGKWNDDLDLDEIGDDIDGLSDYDDMDAVKFSDESENEFDSIAMKKGKRKDNLESRLFVPTEEFAELLEAAGQANQGSSADLSNKDQAGPKQLAWEMKRHSRMKGKHQPRRKEHRTPHFQKGHSTKGKPVRRTRS